MKLYQFLIDYSSNSSIHGIKYVFSHDRNYFTRLFWAIAIVACFIFSGYFVINAFIKWQYEPDIGTRIEIHNIRKIPFPAITLCPQTKTKMKFLSFRNTYKNYWEHFKLYGVSDADAARFESMLHVCEPELAFNVQLNDSKVAGGHDIARILKEISYSVNDSMFLCKFRNVMRDCTKLFKEIMTHRGICYSFNMLDYDQLFNDNVLDEDFRMFNRTKGSSWSLDGGYEDDDLNTYPYPAISQYRDSLKIILKTTDIDLDYVCPGSYQGFKVYFHLPGDFPSISGKHLFVPIRDDVIVATTASVNKISENLRKYKPSQRKCFLAHEKPLKFFRSYTRNACDMECLSNFTLNACGCVKFSMVRENSTKICDYSQLRCVENAKRDMLLSYDMNTSGESECGCLSSCTEINYRLENFQTEFEYKRLFESYRYDLSDTPGVIMSRVTIFFQEPQFETTERYALFNFSDYIASCGGVLGLFMGFSILSLIELFYYLIIWLAQPKCS